MGFVRVQKESAYFKRYQVKLRRRRQGKTDYKARRRLVQQDLNKFKAPKYRFVVRITNRDVVCQVAYSLLGGDIILCAAYAHELNKRYGAKAGSTNYAACYATGLLCARRLLQKLKLDTKYVGAAKLTGEDKKAPAVKEGERRPFKAILDIGLARTTSGSRVFASLKGALDGGLDIPHSDKRFAGVTKDKLDPAKFKTRLLGGHVAAYMKDMKTSDEEKYKAHFSSYLKAGLEAEAIEKMWAAVHAAIRKDPAPAAKKAKSTEKPKVHNRPKMGRAARVHRRTQKKAALRKRAAAGDD